MSERDHERMHDICPDCGECAQCEGDDICMCIRDMWAREEDRLNDDEDVRL